MHQLTDLSRNDREANARLRREGTANLVAAAEAAGDHPATEWLAVYAAGLGAPAPQTVPLPEGTPVGRAVSNAAAWAAGWTPAHLTWRDAFATPQG